MTECSTKEVGIDIETRSSADLVKYGVYAYADSPDFEILLIAYTTDTGVELIDLKQGDDPTEFLNVLKNPKNSSIISFSLY
jgi:DNA polymerase